MKFPWSYSVVVGLFLGACATSKPPSLVDLPATGPQGELVREVPVVDIHTHTFNAHFLPIRNLALGRRDVHWAAFFARPPLLIAITNYITRKTAKDIPPVNDPSELALMKEIAAKANETSAELEDGEKPVAPVTAGELQNDPRVTGFQKIARDEDAAKLTDIELKGLQGFVRMFAGEESANVDKETQKGEIAHFLKCLRTSDLELVNMFRQDHQKRVVLMVSHMMDLAPVFGQKEDGTRLLPFRDQIKRFRAQQQKANGRLLYFVAYNPFRDHFAGGGPGDAVALVKKAYDEQGAFGVKVYPPAGYTPFGNYIPKPPMKFDRQPRKQWEGRYQPDGVLVTREQLDERLLELFRWAVKCDVPLFVHTGNNEVQARKGYAEMAKPARWVALLDAHKELKNIRICFGHAGDSKYWFGTVRKGWGEDVYQLCAKYPNIYCEFGVHDNIVDPDKRENFSARLAELIAESRADSKLFDFSTKILYGSDWYMPMMAGRDRVNYLNAHKDAILKVQLRPLGGEPNPVDTESLYKNYFYRNAIAFLNAKKQLTRSDIPASLQAELQRLVNLASSNDSRSRMRGARDKAEWADGTRSR